MTEWYQESYPHGPMVAVKGFPRSLYPPDAAPKHDPSVDGSDVEAYKRTISRAGRWTWTQFDQAFSNGFSHGKGPNVIDTGVAGFQRQQGIEATGYIGPVTFNALRSIIIPDELPNAGQYAMDARAVELINAAYERFGGFEPDPFPTTSAKARISKALSQVGKTESPSHSNMQEYGSWYGMNGVPWCAIFCTWCDQLSGIPSDSFMRGRRYSYVPYVVSDARLGLNGLSLISMPKPGDLVCYDWEGNGEFDHMGIVFVSPDLGGVFWAIEGNTAVTNDSNGGQVMQRVRNRNSQKTVFIRVAE